MLLLFLKALEVLAHQAPVGVGVEVRLDDFGGRGDRQLHGLAPQSDERLLLLGVDVLAGTGEQGLVLLARLGEQHLSLFLCNHLGLGDDVLRLGPGRGDGLLVLLEQPLRLGVGAFGLLELLLDAALALLHRLDDGGEGKAPQQREQDPEDDERPDDQPGVDTERASASGVVRPLLEEGQQERHQASLKSRANTSAASVAPSTSAAVRIIAPRMSADASGWRAIASTAWPPMRPMPSPAPMMARPIPIPAPSRALLLSAASGVAWSSISMLCMWVL